MDFCSNSFVWYHFVLGKEGYEELTTCMKSVFREMKDLETSGISFQGRHFNIEWYVFSNLVSSQEDLELTHFL